MTKTEFILKTIADRYDKGGYVLFSDLEEAGILPAFEMYCRENGCTLTMLPDAGEAAPYQDFKHFISGMSSPD